MLVINGCELVFGYVLELFHVENQTLNFDAINFIFKHWFADGESVNLLAWICHSGFYRGELWQPEDGLISWTEGMPDQQDLQCLMFPGFFGCEK